MIPSTLVTSQLLRFCSSAHVIARVIFRFQNSDYGSCILGFWNPKNCSGFTLTSVFETGNEMQSL